MQGELVKPNKKEDLSTEKLAETIKRRTWARKGTTIELAFDPWNISVLFFVYLFLLFSLFFFIDNFLSFLYSFLQQCLPALRTLLHVFIEPEREVVALGWIGSGRKRACRIFLPLGNELRRCAETLAHWGWVGGKTCLARMFVAHVLLGDPSAELGGRVTL